MTEPDALPSNPVLESLPKRPADDADAEELDTNPKKKRRLDEPLTPAQWQAHKEKLLRQLETLEEEEEDLGYKIMKVKMDISICEQMADAKPDEPVERAEQFKDADEEELIVASQ